MPAKGLLEGSLAIPMLRGLTASEHFSNEKNKCQSWRDTFAAINASRNWEIQRLTTRD